MSLKFSLRDLLLLIALISVACAAMANTGIWWHSIVVTATLSGMTGLVIWASLHGGSRRAFAYGWLLFAAGYLAIMFSPWTANNLGASLISTKGLAHLEWRAWGDQHSPFVLNRGQQMEFGNDLDLRYTRFVNVNSIWSSYPPTSVWDASGRNWADSCTTFQSTGHWLLASVFGYCGAHLAAFLFRRRDAARAKATNP